MALTVARRAGPVADINVTPMADVMIVLLIIFMVAVPALTREQSLTLPRAQNDAERNNPPLVVVLDRSGLLRLAGATIALPELPGRLESLLWERPEAARLVHVKADEGLPYAQVEGVLEACRSAGAEELVLMTAPRSR